MLTIEKNGQKTYNYRDQFASFPYCDRYIILLTLYLEELKKMTEIETLQRAKRYMEQLANGINPIDGSMIPDRDIVNNVRLSRCFFYVADVLRKVIDNGGIAPQASAKKAPFTLPAEKRKDFAFSAEPITITEIVKRMNDLVACENMIKLTTSVMLEWLLSIDALRVEPTAEGRSAKRPTSRGEMLGVRAETRNGMNGSYCAVVYNREAQQFLLDNIDAALELYHQKTENQGQPWSPEQDQCLRELHQKGAAMKEIAVALKRNTGAVRARLKKLGIISQ